MIRLQRVGRKNIPTFRVVLTDKQNSTKSGRFLEILGAYDPREGGVKKLNGERIKHWLSKGAQASDTLHNLLLSEKIITGKKINVLPRKSPPKPAEVAEKKEESAKTEEKAGENAQEKEAEAVPAETVSA